MLSRCLSIMVVSLAISAMPACAQSPLGTAKGDGSLNIAGQAGVGGYVHVDVTQPSFTVSVRTTPDTINAKRAINPNRKVFGVPSYGLDLTAKPAQQGGNTATLWTGKDAAVGGKITGTVSLANISHPRDSVRELQAKAVGPLIDDFWQSVWASNSAQTTSKTLAIQMETVNDDDKYNVDAWIPAAVLDKGNSGTVTAALHAYAADFAKEGQALTITMAAVDVAKKKLDDATGTLTALTNLAGTPNPPSPAVLDAARTALSAATKDQADADANKLAAIDKINSDWVELEAKINPFLPVLPALGLGGISGGSDVLITLQSAVLAANNPSIDRAAPSLPDTATEQASAWVAVNVSGLRSQTAATRAFDAFIQQYKASAPDIANADGTSDTGKRSLALRAVNSAWIALLSALQPLVKIPPTNELTWDTLSFSATYNRDSYKLIDPTASFANQISSKSFDGWAAKLAYQMQWGQYDGGPRILGLAVGAQRTNNAGELKSVDVQDATSIASGGTTRTISSTSKALKGTYQESVQPTLDVDYIIKPTSLDSSGRVGIDIFGRSDYSNRVLLNPGVALFLSPKGEPLNVIGAISIVRSSDDKVEVSIVAGSNF